MTEYTSSKVNFVSRYANKPLIRSILACIMVNLFSLSAFKLLEGRIILNYLQPHKNEKICDIACGCGEYSARLIKRGCKVVGTDFEKKSIVIAQAFSGKGDFVMANAEKMPVKGGIFDKVVCACALEHFNNGEAAIKEICRILKPDGSVVLTVDSLTYPLPEPVAATHKAINHVMNYYSLSELKKKLTARGFEVTHSRYFVNSPIAVSLFKLSVKHPLVYAALFPLGAILSPLSDFIAGNSDVGIFLAVRAKKVRPSEMREATANAVES